MGSNPPKELLAAVTLAIEEGLSQPQGPERARALELGEDSKPAAGVELERLPASAVAAARCLENERDFYLQGGFPPALLDIVIGKLTAEADEGLVARLKGLPAAERLDESRRVMHKDLHKH